MKPHVYLATPTRDWKVDAAFADARTATIEHLTRLGWSYTRVLGPPGAGDIFIARNMLEEAFFRSGADFLFFLDSDMAWEPASIERLVRYDRPLVGAYYVPREHDWAAADRASANGQSAREASAAMRPNLVLYPDPGDATQRAPRFDLDGALVEAAYLGGGFLCIRRDCLEQMRAHYAGEWMHHRGRRTHMLFEPLYFGENRDRCGEDVGFCRRWRDMGGTVWCDTLASFAHIGPCEYHSPSLQTALRRAFSAPADPAR